MKKIIVAAASKDGEFAQRLRDVLRSRAPSVAISKSLGATDGVVVLLWSRALEDETRSSGVPIRLQTLVSIWSQGGLVVVRRDDTPLPLGLRDLPAVQGDDVNTLADAVMLAAEEQAGSERSDHSSSAPQPTRLGRYRIERTLGKGAMGEVYEGMDLRLGRRVAIKTVLKSNLDEDTARDYSRRFAREAQAVARLSHPNIVQVYDFGEEGETAYLVMEFIEGKELKSFFDANERFELKEAVRIMGELCDALDFAHNAGFIHRDVKPANVMIDSRGGAKLTDFGVARVSDASGSEMTAGVMMVGTPAYMSPEQITGGNVDLRTDIFSAGIILYQLLTGTKPWTATGAWTIAKKIIQEEPRRPSSFNSAVTPLFDAVTSKALAKNPDQRFQSARELAAALRRALEGKPEEEAGDNSVVGSMESVPMPSPAPAVVEADGVTTVGKGGTSAGSQEVELEFWRAIKDGNDPDDFALYVKQFPNGVYAALARRKIAKLRGSPHEQSGTMAKDGERREAEGEVSGRASPTRPASVQSAPDTTTSNPGQLFVSYSHQDRPRVEAIVLVIESMGRRVWVDRDSITGQAGWAGQIVRAIRESRAVVLMASPNSYSSDQVVRELYLAMNHKKPIVPIELESADLPDELQYILAPFQRHRLSGDATREILSRALADV